MEKYDSNFKLVKTFTDTNVPAGFAPFGIREIHGRLFVTFALQNDKKHDDVSGPGNGFVEILEADGSFHRFDPSRRRAPKRVVRLSLRAKMR